MTALESAMLDYLRTVYPDMNVRVGNPITLGPRSNDDWSIEWDGSESLDHVCAALASFWRAAHKE